MGYEGNQPATIKIEHPDITKLTSDLADYKKQLIPENYHGAIVTFIDDDGYTDFLTKFKPIADSKGIKVTLGIVTDWVGTSGKLTVDQLHQLQNEGFEIASHSKTHVELKIQTISMIDAELKLSQDWLKANGFNGYKYFVYPFGNTDVNVKNAVRKYYDYAFDNSLNYNTMPIDNFRVQRVDADYATLSALQTSLDNAISDNGWLVLLSHTYRPDGDINSAATFSIAKMTQFIDYIQSKNVPIMTVSEALKYKGNIISAGEYTQDGFAVSKNGQSKVTNNIPIVVKNTSTEQMDLPITGYKADTLTIVPIYTGNDTFKNTGGTMTVFRSCQKNFSYATFTLWSSNVLYMRKWDDSNSVWGSWEDLYKIQGKTIDVLTQSLNNMDAAITTYRADTETIVPLHGSKDTLLSLGGVMRVFRSSLSNFSYATYTPWNTNSLYMRKWNDTTSAWGTWAKISAV